MLSDWSPPPGQSCKVWPRDLEDLPSVGAVVDSANLHSVISRLWTRDDEAPGYALFSVKFESDGQLERAAILESDLSPSAGRKLRSMVMRRLNAPAEGKSENFRLRVEAGPSPEFAVGARQTCLPALANRSYIESRIKELAESTNAAGEPTLRVWVDTDGSVDRPRIEESSGRGAVDSLVLEVAAEMKFHPALDDRVPVAVWTQMPVAIRK